MCPYEHILCITGWENRSSICIRVQVFGYTSTSCTAPELYRCKRNGRGKQVDYLRIFRIFEKRENKLTLDTHTYKSCTHQPMADQRIM